MDRRTINPEKLNQLKKAILSSFSDDLFHAVGIREIAQIAQVSPKTIYKYFGDKETMLYACIEEEMQTLAQEISSSVQAHSRIDDKIKASTSVWCDFYFSNPEIARIVFLNIPQAYWVGKEGFVQVELHREIIDLIRDTQNSNHSSDATPATLIGHSVMGLMHRLMIRWLVDEQVDEVQTRKAISEMVARLIL
nr:TetR/AcrR family transcriptional regulator [Hyphomonas sp. Mor2]